MKIAFVGKGGSGKTTVSTSVIKALVGKGSKVLAIDLDINQHTHELLGFEYKKASQFDSQIKEYLFKGSGLDLTKIVKTTPPNSKSKKLSLKDSDFWSKYGIQKDNLIMLSAGEIEEEDVGTSCFHGKTGLIELILNSTHENEDEFIIADLTAGNDHFASGLFEIFDLHIVVVDNARSVSPAKAIINNLEKFNKPYLVVQNKVNDKFKIDLEGIKPNFFVDYDEEFYITGDSAKMASSKGVKDIAGYLYKNRQSNYAKHYERCVYWHKKNSLKWMNSRWNYDFTIQIDKNYKIN
jgi:CO dehydrogenase maturation factor